MHDDATRAGSVEIDSADMPLALYSFSCNELLKNAVRVIENV